jgi:DNA primase
MAGRIAQAFLDEVLDRADIVEVIDRRGKLKRSGKNYAACCPFHDEKTPSFSVNPEKQFYYCFGCGAGGNALGFLMDFENIDFPQAVESLAATVGLAVVREESDGRAPQNEARTQAHKSLYALMEEAAAFYRNALREHPQARRAVHYLRERGLSGEIAQAFGIGFAPPGWDNLLAALGTSETRREQLLETGMLVQNEAGRSYDRFRDRIIFPIRDQRGRVVGFGGRVLGNDKPKYLNSPETPIFHKGRELYGLHEARRAQRALARMVVVEGYMDVIALAQHGIRNATATLGTATSETHLSRLFRLCPEVVFCFDGDAAGRKAAFRALEATLSAMQDGRQARFLFLPEGEDPDTMVRRHGASHFEQLVRTAQPLEGFLFEVLAEGLDLSSLDGRARYSKQVMPYLNLLPEGVFRELMLKELAERTGLELSSLLRLQRSTPPARRQAAGERREHGAEVPDSPRGAQARAGHRGEPPAAGMDYRGAAPDAAAAAAAPRARSATEGARRGHANLVQSAIALLLHRPDMARLVEVGTLAELEGSDAALLREIVELLQRRPDSSTAMLLGHWYGTAEGELLSRLAGQERLIPGEGIEQQFRDTVAELRRLPERARVLARVDKLRSTDYSLLGPEQKQELRELLHQLQQLQHAERGH